MSLITNIFQQQKINQNQKDKDIKSLNSKIKRITKLKNDLESENNSIKSQLAERDKELEKLKAEQTAEISTKLDKIQENENLCTLGYLLYWKSIYYTLLK